MMVSQHHLHGILGDAFGELFEADQAHVGRHRDLSVAPHFGHGVHAAHGVLVVFQADLFQLGQQAQRRLHRPAGVRVDAQRGLVFARGIVDQLRLLLPFRRGLRFREQRRADAMISPDSLAFRGGRTRPNALVFAESQRARDDRIAGAGAAAHDRWQER